MIHYEGEFEGEPVEIEFLTDQVGFDSDLVKKVQPDLHAEALRFISIVVENTIELTISGKDLPGMNGQLSVKVPTSAAYIFHKGLVYPAKYALYPMRASGIKIFRPLKNMSFGLFLLNDDM